YHDKGLAAMEELSAKHFMSFHVVRFLETRVEKFLADGNIDKLTATNDAIFQNLDIDPNESYQFVTYKKYQAICKFYGRDYTGAAKTINDLRNKMSLKPFMATDIE